MGTGFRIKGPDGKVLSDVNARRTAHLFLHGVNNTIHQVGHEGLTFAEAHRIILGQAKMYDTYLDITVEFNETDPMAPDITIEIKVKEAKSDEASTGDSKPA